MYCRIHMNRLHGVRHRTPQHQEVREGFLVVAGPGALCARLFAPLAMTSHAELYDVRLVSVRDGRLVLRGFEQAGQQAVLQEWVCVLIDTRHGFDAAGHPLKAAPFPEGSVG